VQSVTAIHLAEESAIQPPGDVDRARSHLFAEILGK